MCSSTPTPTGPGRSTTAACVGANRDYVRRYPVATKRVLRAILKAADICAATREQAARYLRDKRLRDRATTIGLEALKSMPYDRWRDDNPEDTLRFHALRLHEVGMIKSTPQKLIAQGTDWRFLERAEAGAEGVRLTRIRGALRRITVAKGTTTCPQSTWTQPRSAVRGRRRWTGRGRTGFAAGEPPPETKRIRLMRHPARCALRQPDVDRRRTVACRRIRGHQLCATVACPATPFPTRLRSELATSTWR